MRDNIQWSNKDDFRSRWEVIILLIIMRFFYYIDVNEINKNETIQSILQTIFQKICKKNLLCSSILK